MKLIPITLTLLLTACATQPQSKPDTPRQDRRAKPFQSRLDMRQDRILRCTSLFIDKGVEFNDAVKGCKDDIYYK